MYWEAKDLIGIAGKVINENSELWHLRDENCRIAFQHCDKEKKSRGRTVYADTEVIKEKLKVFMPYDFIITFYDGSCAELDEKRLERLMYHELKHVGYEAPDNFKIIPHDLEDFRGVVEKWGVDWVRDD